MNNIKIPTLKEINKELFFRYVKATQLYKDFDKYGYFLLEGGRASGKTQQIARTLLLKAIEGNYRVFCGREIQRSIEDSVYKVFVDLIQEYDLPFEITKTYISSNITKSEIRFAGFREQGRYNIQGLEGIDILWIDEAQAISKPTLDIIIPTIRKPNSKVFFSMNRFKEDDVVYNKFNKLNNRQDTLHLTINYQDNKYLSKKIIDEAELCKKENYNDYLHIWMGQVQKNTENAIIQTEDLRNAVNRNINIEGGVVIGIDVARFGGDRTVFYKRKGLKLLEDRVYEKKDIIEISNYAEELAEFDKSVVFNIDDVGCGGGLLDALKHKGYTVNGINNGANASFQLKDKYCNKITEMFFELKNKINEVSIYEDFELFYELSNRKFKYDKTQRKIVESKDEYKKRCGRSPDKADAFLLCYHTENKNDFFIDII